MISRVPVISLCDYSVLCTVISKQSLHCGIFLLRALHAPKQALARNCGLDFTSFVFRAKRGCAEWQNNQARLSALHIYMRCRCLCADYFACFAASSNSIETIFVTPFSSIVTPKIVSAWRMVGFLCVMTINCV